MLVNVYLCNLNSSRLSDSAKSQAQNVQLFKRNSDSNFEVSSFECALDTWPVSTAAAIHKSDLQQELRGNYADRHITRTIHVWITPVDSLTQLGPPFHNLKEETTGEKVSLSHYRPEQTLRGLGGRGSQKFQKIGTSTTHRPPLPPGNNSWYSFLLEAGSTPGP
jgi:hypothetical protein